MQGSRSSSAAEDGVLLCDKPPGVTSHDVVDEVRREIRAGAPSRRRGPKVGHAGTLDPFATGLLVVLLGRATRLQRFLMELPKTYLATARLGWRSTTGDPDGELTETGVIPGSLELPTGSVELPVPMTSAVRMDGERLYERARRGEEVETPIRRTEVHEARLHEVERDRAGILRTARYEIICSAGTYVRSLLESLGDAYCEELRRTAIGHLQVPEDGRRRLSMAEALSHLPAVELTGAQAARIQDGARIEMPAAHGAAARGGDDSPRGPGAGGAGAELAASDRVRLLHGGELRAVARPVDGQLQPDVVLV